MPSANIDELFTQTLAGDYHADEPWEAVRKLQGNGTREVFEIAAAWCRSPEPLKRARGADILGQLGKTAENPNTLFADESFQTLSVLVSREEDARPLSSAVAALGHLGNPSAVPLIVMLCKHPSDEVRFDLAFALGCFPEHEQSMSALIELMGDEDSDVRDWATFGLGVLGTADSEEIRASLIRNLSDIDEDTREEAIAGLAMRGDLAALRPLLQELKDAPSLCVKEAAFSLLGVGWENSDREPSALAAELERRFHEFLRES